MAAPPPGSKFETLDVMAMSILTPLCRTLQPWTSWSLRPAALVSVLSEIVLHDRHVVVELGSGASTAYLGALLRERAGRLYSVESDPAWAAATRDRLNREGLAETVELVEAPLVANGRARPGHRWYDELALAPLLGESIDVLLVDGPPGAEGAGLARYPALPFFAGSLSTRALVALDDVSREGEQKVLELWEQESSMTFWQFPEVGLAMGSHLATPVHL